MDVTLVLGPAIENRNSMTAYSILCKKIYESYGHKVNIRRLKFVYPMNTYTIAFSRYFLIPFQLIGLKTDIIHVLDHSFAHSLLFTNNFSVITIHDLIPLEKKFKLNIFKKIIFFSIIWIGLQRSNLSFAVSKTTLELVNKIFHKPKNITLAYNPPVNRELQYLPPKFIKDIDILLIGSEKYKNHIYAIEACLNIESTLNIHWINPDSSLIYLLQASHHIFETSSGLIDEELFEIYKRSKLTLNLSFCEGFGWIPFEASRFDCCPLMSDIKIFKELHPSSLKVLQPLDNVQSVSDFVDKLLVNDVLRKKMLQNINNDLKNLTESKHSIHNQLGKLSIIK